MFDLPFHLKSLARIRPYFHSESDFQHALAWEIRKKFPDWGFRLEIPIRAGEHTFKVDIVIRTGVKLVAIELKYKSKKALLVHADEKFDLRNQSAQDLARYDFVKDISRIEYLVSQNAIHSGYAVFLTNESLYWRDQKFIGSIDDDFRIHDRRILAGIASWAVGARNGTIRGREKPIQLLGTYELEWFDYFFNRTISNGHFRCLVVQIQIPKAEEN